METLLVCLKYMFELSVFETKEEVMKAEELLYQVINEIGKTLVLKSVKEVL